MKITVRDQVSLPLRRCFQLCVRGIRYRLFRSAITVVIVALAVAFLMMMLSTSYIDRQVAGDVRQRTGGRRLLGHWVDKLTVPMTGSALTAALRAADEDGPAWRELKRWSGLSDDDLRLLKSLALRQRVYEQYLDDLNLGQRNMLIGSRQGQAVFDYLAQPGRAEEFYAKARKATAAFPTDKETLLKFLEDMQRAGPLGERILAGHAAAVQAVGRELGKRSVLDVLKAAGSPDDPAAAMLRRHGYEPEPDELAALSGQAELAADAQTLAALLRDERMRGVIASQVGVSVSLVSDAHVYQAGASLSGARWLKQEVARTRQKAQEKLEAGKPARVPDELELAPERIVRVCRAQQEQARLSAVEARLSPEGGAGFDALGPEPAAGGFWLGFSRRTGWLIMISFVVCVVGVANAMLMSVTERFREIATMKCLGALDSFIMIIFVLESALQGLAGGLIGVTLGLALGLVLSWWHLGGLALVNLPALAILASAGVCLASGALLASLAAVYPAWVAARLAPMEAMRIE